MELLKNDNLLPVTKAGRQTLFEDHYEELIRQVRRHGSNTITYGELADFLEPASPHVGEAIIQALIARGLLAIDLNRPLSRHIEIRIVGAPKRFSPKSRR